MTPSTEAIIKKWKQAGGKFKAAAELLEKEIEAQEELET